MAASNAYIVEPGDALWRIAQRFGLSTAQLVDWNGITDPGLIHPGEVLRLSPDAPMPMLKTDAALSALVKQIEGDLNRAVGEAQQEQTRNTRGNAALQAGIVTPLQALRQRLAEALAEAQP